MKIKNKNEKIKYTNKYWLSLLIPIYNTEPNKLIRLFNSIKKNNTKNVEIILINDCSTNIETLKFLSAIKNEYTIINNKKNIGLGPSRNVAQKVSKGKYIWFIDSDDYIANNSINLIKQAITNNNYPDLMSINYKILKDNKQEIVNNNFTFNNIKIFGMSTVWSKIIRKDFLSKNNILHYDSRKYHEDEYFTLMLLNNTENIVNMNEIIYYYDNTNLNSITNKISKEKSFNDLVFYLNIFFKNNVLKNNLIKKYISKFIFVPLDFLIHNWISFKTYNNNKQIFYTIYNLSFNKNIKYWLLMKVLFKYIIK